MASFDIVNRIDLQEVDNAVNITKKDTSIPLRFSRIENRDHPGQERQEDQRYD